MHYIVGCGIVWWSSSFSLFDESYKAISSPPQVSEAVVTFYSQNILLRVQVKQLKAQHFGFAHGLTPCRRSIV
jgi:hypothetical protein